MKKLMTVVSVALATTALFAKVDLYEVEAIEETEGWQVSPALEKAAGSKVLMTEGTGDDLEKVFVTGAATYHLWVRLANLYATNAAPSKVVVQFNGGSTTVTASGAKDGFVWQKVATSMTPAGYNAVSISPVKGVKAVLDCFVITDEKDFVPPADAAGMAKLRKENARK